MQDSGPLAVFKVTARDQGQYKGAFRGHLLHTLTFLVSQSFLVDFAWLSAFSGDNIGCKRSLHLENGLQCHFNE